MVNWKWNSYRQEKFFVGGIEKGVGSTHFCILLANFYAEVLGKNTVIIDLNTDRDYSYLGEVCNKDFKRIDSCSYRLRKVTIYPGVVKEKLADILSDDFQAVIIDAGINYKEYMTESSLCDKRLLFCNIVPWKLQTVDNLFLGKSDMFDIRKWNLLYVFGGKDSASYICEKYGVKIKNVPVISDPFRINKRQLTCIEKIMQEAI